MMLPNCSCGCAVVVLANTLREAAEVLDAHPELDRSTAVLGSPRGHRSLDGRRVNWVLDSVDLGTLPMGWHPYYRKLLATLDRSARKTRHG